MYSNFGCLNFDCTLSHDTKGGIFHLWYPVDAQAALVLERLGFELSQIALAQCWLVATQLNVVYDITVDDDVTRQVRTLMYDITINNDNTKHVDDIAIDITMEILFSFMKPVLMRKGCEMFQLAMLIQMSL